jgi:hypothetical protein
MPEQLRVKGHTLWHEGRVWGFYGYGSGPGTAKCSCGWESEVLDSTAARQRAHRAHKMDILEGIKDKIADALQASLE